jgi:hypothetical protein
MRKPWTALPLLALIVLALGLPAAASAKSYDLPALAKAQVAKIQARTTIPVLLPDALALDYGGKLYVSGGATRREWSIGFDGAPGCGGANACFLASISAQRGGKPAFKRTVKLDGGVTGYYKPLSCGGSCSPPELQFVKGGVLYEIAAKVPDAALPRLTRAANQALAAGPR